jgi:hypothetical protein
MENTIIKREGLMTRPFVVNRKITKIVLAAIVLILIAFGLYFGFQASVKYTEGKWVGLIQSDNSNTVVQVPKK